uniref:Gypsy retrotransposon integrase-like protein 1 n=1 Tax=Neogobius melanostomus TaxID=47308 RepID=A0A8C6UA59_9GOBI
MLSADSLAVAQEQVLEAEIEVAQEQILEVAQEQILEVAQEQILEVAQEQVLEVAQEQVLEVAQEQVLEVAQEQVVECGPNKLGDIFTFVSQGSFSDAVTPLRKKNLKRYARKFIVEDGKLFYVGMKGEEKREVVIEPERKRQIFLECHFNDVGGHLGQKKTVHRIQSRYYWLGIIRDVVDWIKLCETCRGAERSKNMSRTVRPQRVGAPWDFITADILGPFPVSARGHTHVLLLVDYFSKWPEASPLHRADPQSIAREISTCVFRFGSPKTIACSQSPEFCAQVSRELLETWGLEQTVTSADPLPDCGAPTLRPTVLRLVEDRAQHWDTHLDRALFPLRTSMNQSTKFSPFSLVFSRTPRFNNQSSSDSHHLRSIQEQQEVIRQRVLENMNAAYKQEKKKKKRKSHKISSILADSDSNSPKVPVKQVTDCSLFLGFPVESVLAAVQSEKTELGFDLHSAQ